MTMKPQDFVEYLSNHPKKYTTLCRYRNLLMRANVEDKKQARYAREKLKHVEDVMDTILSSGLVTKRRKPGTGTLVFEEIPYKDTPTNRKLGRVGKTFQVKKYVDAEFEEHTHTRKRRRKRTVKPKTDENGEPIKRKNPWIECVTEAKKVLNAPRFVIHRKEITDPNDPKQVMGHEVYMLAKKMMQERKEAGDSEVPQEEVPQEEVPQEEVQES